MRQAGPLYCHCIGCWSWLSQGLAPGPKSGLGRKELARTWLAPLLMISDLNLCIWYEAFLLPPFPPSEGAGGSESGCRSSLVSPARPPSQDHDLGRRFVKSALLLKLLCRDARPGGPPSQAKAGRAPGKEPQSPAGGLSKAQSVCFSHCCGGGNGEDPPWWKVWGSGHFRCALGSPACCRRFTFWNTQTHTTLTLYQDMHCSEKT